MERAFAPEGPADGQIFLEKEEAHHLTRVRRAAVGSHVVAFDGQGRAWLCRLADAGKNHAILDVESQFAEPAVQSSLQLILATAVPKGDRFDWIVEKATELGVDRLVPLQCERSVVEPRATKLDRLRRSVIEACKQCGRNRTMTIDEPVSSLSLISSLESHCIGLWADRGGGGVAALREDIKMSERVVVCIGPEGGWTEAERDAAGSHGWRPIGLGPYILRIETAAIAASAVIRQVLMNAGGETGAGPSSDERAKEARA